MFDTLRKALATGDVDLHRVDAQVRVHAVTHAKVIALPGWPTVSGIWSTG